MRMRKKKHCGERLAACGDIMINDSTSLPSVGLNLELGCGKGGFITASAVRYPEKIFVGVERISDVIVIAAEKAATMGLNNVKLMNCDVAKLGEVFLPHTIEKIYLNFSDPWPKKGYAKRRLTHRNYLELYRRLLSEDGVIEVKTDNDSLYAFTVDELTETGWQIIYQTDDIVSSPLNKSNIKTEYETLFTEKGIKIKYLSASPPKS